MKKSTAFLALATTLMSGAAFADIGSTSTTTSIGASAPRLIDKLVITDVAYMSGPSITNQNSLMPDEEGEPGKAVNIENFLGLGYKLSPDLTASANMDTIYTPVSFKD